MGYIFAVITSIFFTAYTIPKKISHQSAMRYSMFQGIGLWCGAAIIYAIDSIILGENAEPLNNPLLLLSALAGLLWFSGCAFFFMAIDEMGLSRSNQWKNLQGPFGAIFNLLFLAEYNQTNVLFVLLSCGFILVSAMFLTIKDPGRKSFSQKGILFAVLAAVCFGLNSMLMKNGTNHGLKFSQLFVLTGTVFVSSVIYLLIKDKSITCIKEIVKKDNLLGISGGLIFSVALLFSTLSYSLIPGSIAFTIIQLNAVWTILVGVLIFKEIDIRKNWLRITLGIICAIVGVVLLIFA